MAAAHHASEIAHSSAWQASQQERDSVFSAIKLLEVENLIDWNAASTVIDYVPTQPQVPQESTATAPAERAAVINQEPLQQQPDTAPAHFVTQVAIDAAAPIVATPTAAAALNAMHDAPTTSARVDVAVAAPEMTAHAVIAHHTPEAAAHVASALATPYATVPAYNTATVDLTHLFQPEHDPLWSSMSGWGEINVSQALSKIVDHPLSADGHALNAPAHLSAMGFDMAWRNGFTGQGVIVADIDTGIDLTNQALMQAVHLSADSWNFLDNSANIQDDNGHGTMTALEIGASDKLGTNLGGGAYDAQVMVLKAMDANGQGRTTVIGEAIHYAVDHGATVINLSLGASSYDLDIQNAMQYAYDNGVIVVAAAGNEGSASIDFPAAYSKVLPNVIAVGASDQAGAHDVLASFSNQAGSDSMYNFVDAIGTHITGYGLNGNLATWSGTSMASPLVAAEAAILKSANPQLSAYEIVQDILHSTNSLDDLLNHYSTAQTSSAATASQAPIQISSVHDTPVETFNSYANADYLHASACYVPTEQYHG